MSTTALATTVAIVVTTFTASYSIEEFQADTLWLLIVGFLVAFVLAFAVGANDVANSFGTTVGAKTLSLKQACILASVFEALGAILLGAKVGETIRKGIIDPLIYNGHEELLMVGEVSAMIGSVLWQLMATFLKLPVSGTHSIVGATVGFSLVAMGFQGVNWKKMGLIVASWFISPIMAGVMAAFFYWLLRRLILLKDDAIRPGLIAMPILYAFTILINFISVFLSGAPLLGFDQIPVWGIFAISVILALVTYLIVRVFMIPRTEKKIKEEQEKLMSETLLKSTPVNNQAPAKKSIMKPTLETISEKEAFVEEEENSIKESNDNGSTNPLNGNNIGAGDGPSKVYKEVSEKSIVPSSPKKNLSKTSVSSADGKLQERKHADSEELKPRQRTTRRSRSRSVGDHHVRLPPLLQLEKNVLKSRTPEPTVQELKTAIRKNFSEPSMWHLTENLGGDSFEVHINRQSRAVTIQRKRRINSNFSESSLTQQNSEHHSQGNLADSTTDADCLLDGVHGSPDQLEEPFDDSEDEGTGLTMKMSKSEEVIVLSSDQNTYTGAIEEGFRKLSTSQHHDIIKIKVAGGADEDSETGEMKEQDSDQDKEDRIEVRKIFSFLQILTACFGSFAHGGNDVSNAIGPLIALFIIYSEGSVHQETTTPVWILFYGGLGICAGLWVWGRRVIKTMGEDLTNLTPSRGFAIELMSAVTVLSASTVGIPVSTTHCKVGAVVSVGWVRSREAVDWKIFRNIVLAWFVTVPVSGGLSAVVFIAMKAAIGL